MLHLIELIRLKTDVLKCKCCWCRAGGLFQDVMDAASRLQLGREPLTALAMSAMLLAFARDSAEQAALRQDSALAVLNKLLQVPPSASPFAKQRSHTALSKSPGRAHSRASVDAGMPYHRLQRLQLLS